MRFLARLVIRFPKAIGAIILALTIGLGLAALRIERRADIEENLPRSNPRLAAFHEFRAQYGSNSSIVIVLSGPDLFTPASLGTLARITTRLKGIDGIKTATSLTNLAEFHGDGDVLRSGPLMERPPATPAEAGELRAKVMGDPWYIGRLISADGRSTLILVTLDTMNELSASLAVLCKVRNEVGRLRGDFTADYAGSLVMDEQIDRCLGRDIAVLFPMVVAAIILVLWLNFRTWRGVILPMLTLIMSVIWTIGSMALLDRPLSLVSNIVPVLLIGIGSAYGIHIVARFEEGLAAGGDQKTSVTAAVEGTGFGVWLAAITTMAGFGSLALSKIGMIFDFGVFSALGVAYAFLISITLIPALLLLLPVGSGGAIRREHDRARPRRSPLAWLAGAIGRRPVSVLIWAAVLGVAAWLGWMRLAATFDPADFLSADSPHRKTEALVDVNFGGSAELEVLVRANLSDPKTLREIQHYQAYMQKLGTSRSVSVVDLLARINRAFHGGDPAREVLPAEPALLPQYLFLLTITLDQDELAQFVNFDLTEARISARISNVMGTAERARLIETLEREAAAVFGDGARVTVTGMPVVELAMMDLIRDEQLQNILSSVAAVLIIVVIAFHSFYTGLFCLAPIGLTILYCFGLMGWTGIPLNAATATMASLATGMGVDYSVHFFRRYQEERRNGREAGEALYETWLTTGRAIVTNALAVGAGFATLFFSGMNIFRSFGGLIALTMILTGLGALTVLPALMILQIRFFGEGRPHARALEKKIGKGV